MMRTPYPITVAAAGDCESAAMWGGWCRSRFHLRYLEPMRIFVIFVLCAVIGVGIAADPPHLVVPPPVSCMTTAPLGVRLLHTGTKPITFSASGLPVGLWLNPTTGFIAGSPRTAGTFTATITASNAAGVDAMQLSFAIASCGPLGVASWGSVPPGMPADLPSCQDVAAGYSHTLALCDDGTVRAWGVDSDGQCVVPNTVIGGTAVAAGWFHSLALLGDGTVVAWGLNDLGQCDVPVSLGHTIALAAGRKHSLALLGDGTVVGWGDLVMPAGVTDIVAIASTDYHVLALRRDGTVVAWGNNYSGQATVPSGLDHVVGIAAGHDHSMALRDDGRMVTWGAMINGAPPRDLRAQAVTAGWGNGLGLADGQVSGWGYDTYGQTSGGAGIPAVVRLVAGRNHTVALARLAPSLAAPMTITAVAGTAVTVALTTTGTPTGFAASGLPVGWSIDGTTGMITGTAQQVGLQVATIMLTNDDGATAVVVPIAVNPPAVWGVSDGDLSAARVGHTSTLLSDGRVLVVGGTRQPYSYTLNSCELFDPGTGRFSPAAAMAIPRTMHTASLLSDGRVLVTGGRNGYSSVASCEIYDPRLGTWSSASPMASERSYHTATVLPSGGVIVVGGYSQTYLLLLSEIYDPVLNTWVPSAGMDVATASHTTTLLATGELLVAGGITQSGEGTTRCEIYTPTTGEWRAASPMFYARFGHTATRLPMGGVLMAGGSEGTLRACEIFDPQLEQWIPARWMGEKRRSHTATLLPSGDVLLAGGDWWEPGNTTAERYRPGDDQWFGLPELHTGRSLATATLLPGGAVVMIGGSNIHSQEEELLPAEVFHPTWGHWGSGNPALQERRDHLLITLADGSVLAAGGISSGSQITDCETFNPLTATWSVTGSLLAERSGFTGTLLSSGEVLAVGGGAQSSCERYQPGSRSWLTAQPMSVTRRDHTATLLPSGKVLVVGGSNLLGALSDSELYDPMSDAWSPAGSVGIGRNHHAAVLLPNGLVLVCGGYQGGGVGTMADCRVFDPLHEQWRQVAPMSVPRAGHTATLLPDGRLLVAGGITSYGSNYLKSCEIFDPLLEQWTPAADLSRFRAYAAAVADDYGVLLLGGGITGQSVLTCEYFDFQRGTWSLAAPLQFERPFARATRLRDGRIMTSGGNSFQIAGAEIWQSSAGSHSIVALDQLDAHLTESGTHLELTGSGFMPMLSTSQGNSQDSTNRFPLVLIRRQDNGAISWVVPDSVPLSDSAWSGTVPADFPNGPASVRVFVNGVASEEHAVLISGHLQLAIDERMAIYDGEPHPVSVMSSAPLDPAATLSVLYQELSGDPDAGGTILLPASTTPPIDAGWYDVRVTVHGSQSADLRAYLHIAPRSLDVQVNDEERRFGEANPALTGEVTGMVDGDGLQVEYSSAATALSPPGIYAIQSLVLDPFGRLSNYVVTLTPGALTIAIGEPTITITDTVFVYDGMGHPVMPQSVPSLDAGSTMTIRYVAWSGDPALPSSAQAAESTATETAPVDAGWYRAQVDVSGHQEASVHCFVHIEPAQLVITVHHQQRRVGEVNPGLTGDITGVVAADQLMVIYSTNANQDSPVGTYPIDIAIDDPFARLGNYQVNIHADTLDVVPVHKSSSSDGNSCGVGGIGTGLAALLLLLSWRSRRGLM